MFEGQSARSDEEMKAMLQNSMEARERAEGEKEVSAGLFIHELATLVSLSDYFYYNTFHIFLT